VSESRYFVPDLSPIDHPEADWSKARIVFVAESPHVSEVTPERKSDRRPLCGMAGKVWWKAVGEVLEGKVSDDVSLARLLALAERHGLIVINAVQLPIDSKVTKQFPEASPVRLLGFDKGPGPKTFKKLKRTEAVQARVKALAERLNSRELSGLPVVCLGNDSEWFVKEALGKERFSTQVICKLPHPSAWWRKGGYFGRVARENLERILKTVKKPTAGSRSSK
jgi:hypothetical protein